MKAVLDTNTVVSGLLWSGPPRRLFDLEREGRFILCTSPLLLEELRLTLSYQRLAHRITVPIDQIVRGYQERCAVLHDLVLPARIFDDPNDNIILGCALTHAADFIVTGDRHLQVLVEFAGIKIVSAGQFVHDVMGDIDA